MEQAHMLYMLEHYKDAINAYSKLISAQHIPDSYFGRALCYIKIAKYSEAIIDLNLIANSNLSHQILYLRALAKSYLGHFQTALIDLKQSLKGANNQEHIQDIQKLTIICQNEIMLGAQYMTQPNSSEKLIYYWYHSATEIIIEFQQQLEEKNVTASSNTKNIDITILYQNNLYKYNFWLYGEIKSSQILKKATKSKFQVILPKLNIGIQWPTIESKSKPTNMVHNIITNIDNHDQQSPLPISQQSELV